MVLEVKNLSVNEKLEIGQDIKGQLPQNIEAEQNVLGSILYNNEYFDKISETLDANHFFDPLHKKIFISCSKLISRGQLASPITLKAFFEENEINLEQFSDERNYLQQLIDGVGNFLAISDFANEIKECFFRRELIKIGSKIVNDASHFNVDEKTELQIGGRGKTVVLTSENIKNNI